MCKFQLLEFSWLKRLETQAALIVIGSFVGIPDLKLQDK